MNIGGTMSKALHCSADLGIPAGFGRIENRHPIDADIRAVHAFQIPTLRRLPSIPGGKGFYRQESGAGRRGPRYTAM